jgi:O-antigen/teichoic acid export membrane protein
MVVTRATAVASVPIVLHALGAPLYAVWVLAGSLVGIQSLFDLGVASAMVRYVAVGAAAGSRHAVYVTSRRALAFYAGLSLLVGIPMWLLAGQLADLVSYIDAGLRDDAIVIIRWAAVAFGLTNVVIVFSSTLQGIGRVGECYRDQVIGWFAYIPLLAVAIDVWSPAQAVGLAWVGSYALQLVLLVRTFVFAIRAVPYGKAVAPRIREMLAFGARWQVSALADFATFQLPRIAGSFAVSANALVGLDVAMRAAQMAAGPLLAFYPTVLPRATALLTKGDMTGFRAFLGRYHALITVAVLIGASALVPLEVPALAAWTGREVGSFNPLVGAAILVGTVAHASTGILSSGMLAIGDVNSVVVYKARQLGLAVVLLPPAALLGVPTLAVGVGVVLLVPALLFNRRAERTLEVPLTLSRPHVQTLLGLGFVQATVPLAVVIALRESVSAWVLLAIALLCVAAIVGAGWWLVLRRQLAGWLA